MTDYSALWRSSACEAVPYTEDFPQCLHVLPELIDGAIGQGNATQVIITLILHENTGILKVTDNGKGILGMVNLIRLLSWASQESTNVHHRYGHGSKKCLTKWCKDYNTAKWNVKYRTCDKRGNAGPLYVYKAPFVGIKKEPTEDDDEKNELLRPSGTEWEVEEFDRAILENVDVFSAIKEIIRTRYSKEHFMKTEFILKVSEVGKADRQESSKDPSNDWRSFEECLLEEVESKKAECIYNSSTPFNNATMHYSQYRLLVNGKEKYMLREQFPRYGTKGQNYARLHIAIAGRTIEIPKIYEFYEGRTNTHNDFNGYFGIVKFILDDSDDVRNYEQIPTPSTTKVSFDRNCPNYKKFVEIMYDIHRTLPSKKIKAVAASTAASSTAAVASTAASTSTSTVASNASIIPLNNIKKREPNTTGKGPRMAIWHKYIGEDILKHKCLCCKLTSITINQFEVGHVISKANGGNDSPENKRPICMNCNRSMGKTDMVDYIHANEYYFG